MRIALSIAALLTVLVLPSHARAQALSFELRDGLVTIDAQNVSVWEILQRWSAVGGVTFVDADQIPRTPVTLMLTREPEITALGIVLRGVSGYIVARREPSPSAPPSIIDRVLIVANSVAPRVAAPLAAQERRPGIALVQQGAPQPDDDDGVLPLPPVAGDTELTRQGPAVGIGGRNAVNGPATMPARVTTPGSVSPVPVISPIRAQQSPTGRPTGFLDDNGNPVIGPTILPEQEGDASNAPSEKPSGNPGATGSAGAARPGTITPVQRPQ
jgi:hypothetical protein